MDGEATEEVGEYDGEAGVAPKTKPSLMRLPFGNRAPYGQVQSQSSGASRLFSDCMRGWGLLNGQAGYTPESEEEALLFALTWASPQRYGIPPSPRNGHSMVLIGMHLFIFAGGDESTSFNDVHTLHVGSMTWDKPVVHGTLPSPRSRHSATAVGNNMVVFGGVGGGNELHILEVDNVTWYVPKVGGEPPLPRFGHSATLVESRLDQSRKIYLFGGHDGRRSLSDLHIFDTESMNWSKVRMPNSSTPVGAPTRAPPCSDTADSGVRPEALQSCEPPAV
jgi:hypothetical protein